MEIDTIVKTLRALVQSVDPGTGEITPRAELIERREIIECIRVAEKTLSELERRKTTQLKPEAKKGQAWSEGDEALLLESFNSGLDLEALARLLHRSPSSINARLIKLGATEGF